MNVLPSKPSMRRGLREAAIAIAPATIIAASPFVPPRLPLKSAVFVVIAAAIYLYRSLYRARTSSAEEADAEEPEPRALVVSISPLVAVSVLGLAIIFQPTLAWMYSQWTSSVWLNTHGIFVPPLVVYLAYIVWRRDSTTEPESSPWAFAFLVPAMLLFAIDLSLRTRFISSVAFVLCLPGLSLLFLGSRRTAEMRLPLLIAIFMIPLPYMVSSVLFLRELTTVGVVGLLRMAGVAVFATDTVLVLPWGQFRVGEACSGVATFYSAIAIATVFAGLSNSRRRGAVLLLSAVPLAVASNVARVLVLVLLCKWFGNELLETPIHEGSGAATFAVVFVVLHYMSNPRQIRVALK